MRFYALDERGLPVLPHGRATEATRKGTQQMTPLTLFVWESQELAREGLGLILAVAADASDARTLAFKAAADWPGGPGIPDPVEHERFVAAIVEETHGEPRTAAVPWSEPGAVLVEGTG